jgi:hypothetical protein
MKHIKFTYVDSVTGVSIAKQPATNGPVFPAVAGLEYVWARESRYPTDVPEFFGTCPDDADTQVDGVLGVYLQADWETMREDEMRARGPQSQFEKDQSRYTKRAAVKDELMAYMAADNMGRVRSGVWSVADLTSLLGDPHIVAANALMGTLSFELAAAQISAATTPLLTSEIKSDWTSRLEAHYYLEG